MGLKLAWKSLNIKKKINKTSILLSITLLNYKEMVEEGEFKKGNLT
ncbi:unnamed protein product [marine sediment metagenome]|uniref:Uncharacterized protein n=1 Tax=marine sediment metagenome TaxID=412755 RepID=X0Y3D1_9ZZZZ